MEKNELKIVSDKEFDNMFSDFSEDNSNDSSKKNAFLEKQGKSDIDKLLDQDNPPKKDEDDDDEDVSKKEKNQLKKGETFLDNLDENLENSNDADEENPFLGAVSSLVEKGLLQVFVDDNGNPEKDLKEYTPEELAELIESNITTAIETTAQNAPVEMFKTFPKAVQDVVHYTLSGGNEDQLKGLFQQLAQVQETLDLDPSDENDARKIIKQHFEVEGIQTAEEIEDSITKIEDLGKLSEYGQKYKKILDAKQAAVLQKRLSDQEEKAKQKEQLELQKNAKFYESLKVPFEDLELDVEVRKSLYAGLTTKKFQDDKGDALNELEYLVRQKQLGSKEDVESVVKAFAFLKNPVEFMNSVEKKIKAKIQKELTAEIKDGNSKNASTEINNNKNPQKKRNLGGLPKANIFAKN